MAGDEQQTELSYYYFTLLIERSIFNKWETIVHDWQLSCSCSDYCCLRLKTDLTVEWTNFVCVILRSWHEFWFFSLYFKFVIFCIRLRHSVFVSSHDTNSHVWEWNDCNAKWICKCIAFVVLENFFLHNNRWAPKLTNGLKETWAFKQKIDYLFQAISFNTTNHQYHGWLIGTWNNNK